MRPIGAKIASGSSERESEERRFELTPLPEYDQEDTGRREKKTAKEIMGRPRDNPNGGILRRTLSNDGDRDEPAKKQPISSHQDHDGPQTGNRKQEAIRL